MTSPMFRKLRLAEITDSIELLRQYKATGDLLEIGAGTGWQSRVLSDAGYHVEAIDLPAGVEISNHARSREWHIHDYDGSHIPLGDASLDVAVRAPVGDQRRDVGVVGGAWRGGSSARGEAQNNDPRKRDERASTSAEHAAPPCEQRYANCGQLAIP